MKKDYDTFGIAISLIILVLFIAVFLVFIYSKTKNENDNTMNKNGITNTMNNKEQFANIAPLTSDELLEKLKSNPDGLQEVVALDNLTETIKDIINSKIEDLTKKDVMDDLPIGMIIMWNKEELPSTKWKWCNGENNTPNLKYRFPLGGRSYGGEEGKPEGDNDGLIKKNNVPKHRHPMVNSGETFPSLNHTHGASSNHNGAHAHTGTTSGAGQHKHSAYITSHNDDNGTILEAKALTYGQKGVKTHSNYANYSDLNNDEFINEVGNHSHTFTTSSAGSHNHVINISPALADVDNQIKAHIVGEGPIYGEGEQKPFYPHYTLINFIIKVE